ncbi:MAG: GNAT family N-acetyltransferase [Firmicutes bacterium]|nr:GNAT family N-acetyltransferase [Bacillota bacterium]
MEIIFKKVCNKNVKTALQVQHSIFPDEHGDKEIFQAIGKEKLDTLFLSRDLWLAYFESFEPVGILGIYSYKEYPETAWLDWFGILPNHRHKGYGSKLLEFAIIQATQLGFESLRLWTDDKGNAGAVAFYQKVGFDLEIYSNLNDEHFQEGNTVILSVGLNGKRVKKWKNKNIYLKQFYHDVLGKKQ